MMDEELAKRARRLWVQVKGTELGLAIAVDPSRPLKENIKMALDVAKKEVDKYGLMCLMNIKEMHRLIVGQIEASKLKGLKILFKKEPKYSCVYEKCPHCPKDKKTAMVGGCKHYLGYGYCSNKKYGVKLA